MPTSLPSNHPTIYPTSNPVHHPTINPSILPSQVPSVSPTLRLEIETNSTFDVAIDARSSTALEVETNDEQQQESSKDGIFVSSEHLVLIIIIISSLFIFACVICCMIIAYLIKHSKRQQEIEKKEEEYVENVGESKDAHAVTVAKTVVKSTAMGVDQVLNEIHAMQMNGSTIEMPQMDVKTVSVSTGSDLYMNGETGGYNDIGAGFVATKNGNEKQHQNMNE